jgi:hypothetical protein
MIIRCPSCGREGNAPESRGRASQTVRCRPCGTRFVIDRTGGTETKDPDLADLAVAGAIARLVHERARVTAADNGDDDDPLDDASFSLRLQSDWQGVSSAVLGGDPDDSQVELPAFTSESPPDPSGEIESAPAFESESSEIALPIPWYYKFIESWGRVHFYVVLGFATSSLAVLGFLLISALVAGHALSPSITALIIGCVGTVAFLLLSLSATVLIILVIDLGRSVRVLIQQTGQNPARVIDSKKHARTSLSQPVG